jgi:hypothetical protein
MKLQIGGRGTREELISRLQDWHRKNFNYERRSQGSNFSLLEVELPPSPPKDENNPEARRNCGVSPTLLSPLKTKPRRLADGSPVSILSTAKNVPRSSEKKRLNFSIFNQTKIIPPRQAIQRKWAHEDGEDFDAPSSEDEAEEEDMGPCAPQSAAMAVQDDVGAWLMGNAPMPHSPAVSRKSAFDSDDEDAAESKEENGGAARSQAIPCALNSAPASPVAASASRPLGAVSSASASRNNITSHANSMLQYASSLLKQAAAAANLGPSKQQSGRNASIATAPSPVHDDMYAIEENMRNLHV